MSYNWHSKDMNTRTFGAKVSDWIASGMGSWPFLIAQSIFIVIWMVLNIVHFVYHWDAPPFILLNLLFSVQAAYAAPLIMMSQNRQSERDRHQAEHDYKVNEQAKEEIEELQKNLARIENEKLDKILEKLP